MATVETTSTGTGTTGAGPLMDHEGNIIPYKGHDVQKEDDDSPFYWKLPVIDRLAAAASFDKPIPTAGQYGIDHMEQPPVLEIPSESYLYDEDRPWVLGKMNKAALDYAENEVPKIELPKYVLDYLNALEHAGNRVQEAIQAGDWTQGPPHRMLDTGALYVNERAKALSALGYKVEVEPEVVTRTVTGTEVQTQTMSEPEPGMLAQFVTEPEVEIQTETEPGVKIQTVTEPEVEAQVVGTEPVIEAQSVSDPVKMEAQAVPEPAIEDQAVPEPAIEDQAVSEPEMEAVTTPGKGEAQATAASPIKVNKTKKTSKPRSRLSSISPSNKKKPLISGKPSASTTSGLPASRLPSLHPNNSAPRVTSHILKPKPSLGKSPGRGDAPAATPPKPSAAISPRSSTAAKKIANAPKK